MAEAVDDRQLILFRLPRELVWGEPGRCGRCGRCDHDGGFGPPVLMEIRLPDGDRYNASGAETWLCRDHRAEEWRGHMERKRAGGARRRRLAVFAACAREGLRGVEKFQEAERRLAAGGDGGGGE